MYKDIVMNRFQFQISVRLNDLLFLSLSGSYDEHLCT